MHYLFFLGRKSELGFLELQYLLKRLFHASDVTELAPGVALVTHDVLDLPLIQESSGGVVKSADVLDVIEGDTITKETIFDLLIAQVNASGKKKVTFSLYEHGKHDLGSEDLTWLKKEFQRNDISARYLETDKYGLSAAQLLHHTILELSLVHAKGKIYVGLTKTVQDIDAWSTRDFGKPYRDAKKGMLPPKLARIMVNFALGERKDVSLRIYDPFCGSGTILMEAATMGYPNVIGSDLDPEAIKGTRKNLEWLNETMHLAIDTQAVFQSDVVHISLTQLPGKVDCIVTEPFLGKTNPREFEAQNILKGLGKMYLGMFKAWRPILQNGARLVVVFPQLQFDTRVKNMDAVIDMIEALGYTRENGPFIYDRPQTIVQRAIYIFRYSK